MPLPLFSAYLRSRDGEPDQSTSLDQPLIYSNEQFKKKAFHGRVRVKSTDDFSDDRETEALEEDPLEYIYNNQWISPRNSGAKALVHLIHTIDFAFGSVLIICSLQRIQDDHNYGYLISSLTAGLLLLSGSIAGFCLHTPLGTRLFGSNEARRSLVVFNIALALIAVGVYYILALSQIVTPLTSEAFSTSGINIGARCAFSLLGFALSVAESYRIIFIHYHSYLTNELVTEARLNSLIVA